MHDIQSKYEVLSSSKCGIEFEFFTELTAKEVCKSLGRELGKRIIVPIVLKGLDKKETGNYHSEMEPTATMFKLERDYSGGKDMFEMITGPLAYEEARLVLIKTMQWIQLNGWTDPKCAIHLNVSFNPYKSKLKLSLMNLNILKFILGFDEEFIYSRFPNRRDSVYAKSINNIYPVNRFVFYDKPDNVDATSYIVPDEKYYGVNFTKLAKDYLELRYLGGDGYEFKISKILEVLDYFIFRLYDTLEHNDTYTSYEKNKLMGILRDQKKVVECFSDPEIFLLAFPDILITVDMKGEYQIIKAYWVTLRDKLFTLVADSGLKKGHFNYDTDMAAWQLKNAVMNKANKIKNMEIFDSELSGTFEEVNFYRCNIKTSRLLKCKLIDSNEVYDSKVEHTASQITNKLEKCYINNPTELIDCEVISGVIRRGIIGKNAEISPQTLIVDSKEGGDKKDSTFGFTPTFSPGRNK